MCVKPLVELFVGACFAVLFRAVVRVVCADASVPSVAFDGEIAETMDHRHSQTMAAKSHDDGRPQLFVRMIAN